VKDPEHPLKELDRPRSRSGHLGEEKNLLPLPEFESRIVHAVVSNCTDYDVSATTAKTTTRIIKLKAKVIPVVTGATGTISKSFTK
jgi:hypothetical protein